MPEATLHPMLKWWRTKSNWSDGTDFPADALSEGMLAVHAWNAAVDEVIELACKNGVRSQVFDTFRTLKYKP